MLPELHGRTLSGNSRMRYQNSIKHSDKTVSKYVKTWYIIEELEKSGNSYSNGIMDIKFL